MFETVEVPVWLLSLGAVLAAVAALDRLLMPSVRWYLRKRLNRAIDRLNATLDLKIQPFKLTRRTVLIDRLAHDPKVLEAVAQNAAAEGIPYRVAADKALRFAREIVPSFSAFAYFGLAIRAARWLSQSLYRVRLGTLNEVALAGIDRDATVVFVMNHRSNMDYVLVTYLAASRSALSYAVGEWAMVWPLRTLIRAMGAYFIRRRSDSPLYRKVLARYVQMATEGGVTQAIFPEGGLSRDGSLGRARLGLLSYIVEGFDTGGPRDVVFIPVGLNYDRVLEDRVLIAAQDQARPRFRVQPWTLFGFVGKHFWLRMTGRFHRYGYASVGFGAPVSLRAYLLDNAHAPRKEVVARLGVTLMQRVGAVVPVLPVSLVATVLLRDTNRLWSRADIAGACKVAMAELAARGMHRHIPRDDEDYAVEVGLRMLISRNILLPDGDGLRIAPDGLGLIRYYANGIAHLSADQAQLLGSNSPSLSVTPDNSR